MFNIALDAHKRYSFVGVQTPDGQSVFEGSLRHQAGRIAAFLAAYPKGCPVAVETVGNWYWILDEIEQAGMRPLLVHARRVAVCGLRRDGAAGAQQRGQDAARTASGGRESLPQVGLRGGRPFGGVEPQTVSRASRQPGVYPGAGASGASDGDRGGGSALGGSDVLDGA